MASSSKSTHPEIFIIESLRPNERHHSDGKALKTVLSLNPMRVPDYHSVANRGQLLKAAAKFREGHYRWLHLSCHGNTDGLELHGEDVSFAEFAKIFRGKLNKLRLPRFSGHQKYAETSAVWSLPRTGA